MNNDISNNSATTGFKLGRVVKYLTRIRMPWPKFGTDDVIMTSQPILRNHVSRGSFALKIDRVVKYLTRIRMAWPKFRIDNVIMTS